MILRPFILLSLILVLFAGNCRAKSNQTAVLQHGSLYVKDGQMVGKDGLPPRLRGISLSWSCWDAKQYYNPELLDWLVTDFRINLVRLAMGVEPKGGYLSNPDEQWELMCKMIDESIDKGIYVLIDWHDHHAENHVNEAKMFFGRMAQKYASSPNIIYEIYNEPKDANWPVVKAYAEEVIQSIRKYDEKNIIVVGSPRWDQDVDVAALDPITKYSNIVYSFHFYASDPGHQEKLRAKADKAIKHKLPLFVTEWGVSESNGNGRFDRQLTDNWLKWLEDNQLSWAMWHISSKNETSSMLKAGASPVGKWSNSDLTPNGQFVKEAIQKLNR